MNVHNKIVVFVFVISSMTLAAFHAGMANAQLSLPDPDLGLSGGDSCELRRGRAQNKEFEIYIRNNSGKTLSNVTVVADFGRNGANAPVEFTSIPAGSAGVIKTRCRYLGNIYITSEACTMKLSGASLPNNNIINACD